MVPIYQETYVVVSHRIFDFAQFWSTVHQSIISICSAFVTTDNIIIADNVITLIADSVISGELGWFICWLPPQKSTRCASGSVLIPVSCENAVPISRYTCPSSMYPRAVLKRLSCLLSRHVLVSLPLELVVRARLLLGMRSSCLSQKCGKTYPSHKRRDR